MRSSRATSGCAARRSIWSRARAQCRFGSPIETIRARKIARIARAAQAYLGLHGLTQAAARFDVVGVDWTPAGPECTLVRSAFESPF